MFGVAKWIGYLTFWICIIVFLVVKVMIILKDFKDEELKLGVLAATDYLLPLFICIAWLISY